jgi:hypothetical protein
MATEIKTNQPYEVYADPEKTKKDDEEEAIPRLTNQLMSDEKTFSPSKIGPYAKRSARNDWAASQEATVRSKCPSFYYISYDVSANQNNNFSEFTYTEFPGGGLYASTQSREINCRLVDFASKQESGKAGKEALEKFTAAFSDKYIMDKVDEQYQNLDNVIFMPGHNLIDLADIDYVLRIINETDDVYLKPHPLTSNDAIHGIAGRVGWNKVIPKYVSGAKLLKNCKNVYTTTASEFSITGAALGKRVHNISRYQSEGAGVYQPFSRVVSIAQKTQGIEEAKTLLGNILACKWSGLFFEFQDDVEERMDAYYAKALELRELYRPLSTGRGDLDKRVRKVEVPKK